MAVAIVGVSVEVPQLFETVIVCAVTDGRLVYNASSAAPDNLQFATVNVSFGPVLGVI